MCTIILVSAPLLMQFVVLCAVQYVGVIIQNIFHRRNWVMKTDSPVYITDILLGNNKVLEKGTQEKCAGIFFSKSNKRIAVRTP